MSLIMAIREKFNIDTIEDKLCKFESLIEDETLLKAELKNISIEHANQKNLLKVNLEKSNDSFIKSKIEEKLTNGEIAYLERLKQIKDNLGQIQKDKVKLLGKNEELANIIKNKSNKTCYADCIITNEYGEFLLLKRTSNSSFMPDTWCLPGGHIDISEDPLDAAKRELQEETNLTVFDCELSTIVETEKAIIYYFNCIAEGEVILDSEEHSNFDYVPLKELGSIPLMPNLKFILEKNNMLSSNEFDESIVAITKGIEQGILKSDYKDTLLKKIEKGYNKKLTYSNIPIRINVKDCIMQINNPINVYDYISKYSQYIKYLILCDEKGNSYIKEIKTGLSYCNGKLCIEPNNSKITEIELLPRHIENINENGEYSYSLLNGNKITKEQAEDEIDLNKRLGYKTNPIDIDFREGLIEKARAGIYKNTPENIKEGIAGQKYGNKKEKHKEKETNINKKEYGKIKQESDDIINGTKFIDRLSQEEEQGRIRGGRINVEATLLLGASKDSKQELQEREKQLEQLKDFAKKTGCWVDDYKEKFGKENLFDKATESEVFYDKNGYVIKVNNFSQHEDISEMFDRVALQNYLFKDTGYEVLGFTERENDEGKIEVNVILKQPFIQMALDNDGEVLRPPKDELDKEMSKFNLRDLGGNMYINESYLVEDLHSENFCYSKEGKIMFIDPVIRLNLEGEGYGGKRKYKEIKVLPKTIQKSNSTEPLQSHNKHKILESIFEKADKKDYGVGKHIENVQVMNKKTGKIYTRKETVGHKQEEKKQEKGKKSDDTEDKKKLPIEEQAKEASGSALEIASKEAKDPEVRVAAHKELDRRNKEESVQEEPKEGEEEKKEKPKKDIKDKTKNDTKKESSDTKNEDTVESLVKELKSLREEDIDYSDLQALEDNTKKQDDVRNKIKKIKDDESSLRKVSFDEYRSGFKSLSGDKNVKERIEFYDKGSSEIKEYLNNNLTEERVAINTYVGRGFVAIRSYLSNLENYNPEEIGSSMDSETVKKVSKDLSNFISNNKIKENLSLNRRVKGDSALEFFKGLEKGDIYIDKSFSSTSLIELPHFGNFNIEILAKKGSNVANTDNLGELEYLIDKNSQFRVLDKTDTGIIVELL